eukprot:3244128-Alexandrium_andersonii.AAC.1
MRAQRAACAVDPPVVPLLETVCASGLERGGGSLTALAAPRPQDPIPGMFADLSIFDPPILCRS